MKFYNKINILCLIFSATFFYLPKVKAIAGGQDGGGGGVIHCEKTQDSSVDLRFIVKDGKKILKKIPKKSFLSNGRKFQFIDLWEAENGYGPFIRQKLTIPTDNRVSKKIYLENAFQKLGLVNAQLAELIRKYHVYITSRMQPIPPGNYVIPPRDTDIRFLPRGCLPLGFGAYSDREDNLVYDAEIMSKILTIDQAAFEIHEAVYKYLRESKGHASSWKTRHIVGLMFSNEPFTWQDIAQDFK